LSKSSRHWLPSMPTATAADFSFSRASGFRFSRSAATSFPAARALKKLSITQTSRARAARCRGAPATRTVPPRARGTHQARSHCRQGAAFAFARLSFLAAAPSG
jgi:hypothetical protein